MHTSQLLILPRREILEEHALLRFDTPVPVLLKPTKYMTINLKPIECSLNAVDFCWRGWLPWRGALACRERLPKENPPK